MPETKKPLPVPAADRVVQPGEPVALARRRLLHGGLAAGPVLMTLVSRPVLGSVQCVTPSAFISGNASVAGNLPVCTGFSPDDWVDNPNWPPPFTPDTPFCDVFGPSPPYCCDTFIDVIAPVDTSPPDPPSDPAPTGGRQRKHRRDDGSDSNSKSNNTTSGDRWTLNRGPTGHKQLDLGSLRPKTLDLGSADQQTFDLGALGQKRLNVGSANQHVASANQSRGSSSQDNEETNLHSHPHGLKHKGQGQSPPPVSDPPPPDPIPVDPLGCNNNNPAPTPDPVSDPTPPTTSGGKKRKSKRRGDRTPQPNDDLARHVVSAALNAQAGLTPPLTVHTVKGMWRDYITQGYYEPTAGVQWSKQDILTYLASTQPA